MAESSGLFAEFQPQWFSELPKVQLALQLKRYQLKFSQQALELYSLITVKITLTKAIQSLQQELSAASHHYKPEVYQDSLHSSGGEQQWNGISVTYNVLCNYRLLSYNNIIAV